MRQTSPFFTKSMGSEARAKGREINHRRIAYNRLLVVITVLASHRRAVVDDAASRLLVLSMRIAEAEGNQR